MLKLEASEEVLEVPVKEAVFFLTGSATGGGQKKARHQLRVRVRV